MKTFFLKKFSQALNSVLKLDKESQNRLQQLQGKVVTITLLPWDYQFHCTFDEQGVRLQEELHTPSDTLISGTPLQMLGMMVNKTNRQKFFADDIKIEGSAEIGQAVIHLFDQISIDWQEQLSHLIGDVATHQVDRFANNAKEFLKKLQKSFSQDVDDYIHEEIKIAPSSLTLKNFYTEVDELRETVDRLEAKVASLTSQFEKDKK